MRVRFKNTHISYRIQLIKIMTLNPNILKTKTLIKPNIIFLNF